MDRKVRKRALKEEGQALN
uniref:Uncharacterized protein n=1 Tax=Rhizophora mucronata TaxID=61149 RepID=A0A2P2LG63_RHIMU